MCIILLYGCSPGMTIVYWFTCSVLTCLFCLSNGFTLQAQHNCSHATFQQNCFSASCSEENGAVKKFALWLIGISDLGGCFSFSCCVQNFHFGRRNILVSWDSEKIIATPPVETIWVLALLVSSKIKVVLMESLQLTD